MQRKGNVRMSCDRLRFDIVKTVFYAIVASAWASVVIDNHDAVSVFINSVFCFVRSNTVADLFLQHQRVWLSIGIIAFLTLYFHDEWVYGGSEEYPKESPIAICFSWLAFLVQVCLIPVSVRASAVAGLVGIAIITLGLVWFREKVKCARFVLENCVWVVSLVAVAWNARFAWLAALVSFVIILFRFYPRGLPMKSSRDQA